MEKADAHDLDPAILERARRGDSRAFAQIVERYQKPVYNLAYRMLGSAGEAEDAAQETFLRAYAQLKTWQPQKRFTPWLLSITAHYCIDRLRRRKFLWFSIDDEKVRETLPDTAPEPEAIALRDEQIDQVQDLLRKLAPPQRAVVVLKYWNDLSVEEIAQMTGDSVASVKVKLFRARQAMAKELERKTRNGPAAHWELGRSEL